MNEEEIRVWEASLKASAARFVEDVLYPAQCEPDDGGLALHRAIVAAIFKDAGFHDAAGDMENSGELLEIARRSIEEGRRA